MSDESITNISLTIEPDLLKNIDERAKALDLNRSQYFRRLARKDLTEAPEKPRLLRPRDQRKAA